MPWIIFLTEFLILFLTSRFLFKSFFALLYLLFRSQKLAILLVCTFFFPGVFVHEMSHLLGAIVVGVKTHGIEFMPQLTGTRLKMGSARVDKSDAVRSLFIGVAPVIVGSIVITGSLFLLGKWVSFDAFFKTPLSIGFTILFGYLIFVITNTMFSSKKDVEGLFELSIVAGILCGALYFLGLRPHEWVMSLLSQEKAVFVIEKIDWLLAVPVVINIAIVLLSFPFLKKINLA